MYTLHNFIRRGKVIALLRCITIDEETIIASNCDKDAVKGLSKEKKIFCPNCKNSVIFKPGNVYRSHFAHSNSDCVVTNYEPETGSHLKGKQILYEWLKSKYPNADVEYEVYIHETGQIADVFVEHTDDGMEGLQWAFEFQHSPLGSTEWERRHELYKSAGIQDFWILDQAKFLKFSQAKDITDARIRSDLEKAIYNKTGLCYFLDLDSRGMTIDFKFIKSHHSKIVRGVKRQNEYTYHNPIQHKTHIDRVQVRMNEKFKHGVLVYSEIEGQMKDRLSWVVATLEMEQEKKEKQELREKAEEKWLFTKGRYGEEQTEVIWRFIKANKPEFKDDIRHLSEKEFFDKYAAIFEKLQLNIQELNTLKESGDLLEKIIGNLIYESNLFSFELISEQESLSLKEYLNTVHHEKVDVALYVYDTYKGDLEKLADRRFDLIKKKLAKINPLVTPATNEPTAIDYVIRCARLETREAADEHMKQVKKQIIDYNPFNGS